MTAKKKIPDDCMPKCGTCAFGEFKRLQELGECHNAPPVPVYLDGATTFAFPIVPKSAWCSKFQRKVN